jgi:uncharacterized protein YneF (UPF0154 family)
MKRFKNLLNVLGFLAFMLIGFFTATGDILHFIKFDGVANEIAFCMISFMIAGMFMLSSILPDAKKKETDKISKHGLRI